MMLLIPILVLSIPTLSDADVLESHSDIVGIAEGEIDGVANPNLNVDPELINADVLCSDPMM